MTHEMIVTTMAKRVRVVLSVSLLGVCALSASPSAETSDPVQRRAPEWSLEQEVGRALGYLTYVLRSEDPSLVAAEFATLLAPGALAVSTAEAAIFFDLFRAPSRSPLVYLANPQIVVDGTSVVVTCLAHWQLVRDDGTVLRLKERERLVFELNGDRLELRRARSSPLVVKHGGDSGAYLKGLAEVDRAMVIDEAP